MPGWPLPRKRRKTISSRTASAGLRLAAAVPVAVAQVRYPWAWAGLDAVAVPLTAWQLWKVAHGNGYSATEQTVQANAAAISEETGADHEQVIRSWAIAAPLLALLLPSLAIMNAVASLSARAARHGFAVRRQRQAAGVAVLAAGVAVPPLLYGWLALSAVALCLGMPRLWLLLRHGSPQRLSPGRRRLAVIAVSDCVLMPWEIAARGIQLLAQGRYWTSGKG